MKRIFTYGGDPATRNLTFLDLKTDRRPHRYILTNPSTQDEAADCEALGIDLLQVWDTDVAHLRQGAPTTLMIAAQSWSAYTTHDEILQAAISSLEAGADAIYTARGLDVVEMLASQGIVVQGHIGLVPRRSVRTGGLRPIGKTAAEALRLVDDARRFESAGGVLAEVELVPEVVVEEIQRQTDIVTVGLGAGTTCSVIFQFLDDLTGDTDAPRHARAYADLRSLRRQIRDERKRVIAEWRTDALSGECPGTQESVTMDEGELDRFQETIA